MNSVRSNNKSLKYHSFTPSGCKVIVITKFELVAKTQLLLTSSLKGKTPKFHVRVKDISS